MAEEETTGERRSSMNAAEGLESFIVQSWGFGEFVKKICTGKKQKYFNLF
jgi:hypothetical protein